MLNKMLWEITTKYIRENNPIKINPPYKRVISERKVRSKKSYRSKLICEEKTNNLNNSF